MMMLQFSEPDGLNDSVNLQVEHDGVPVPGKLYTLPARCGIAVELKQGQRISITNPSGSQVCDFWAFTASNPHEFMSMEHVHTDLGKIIPKVGDRLVTTRRRAILTLEEDTSPGIHDTLIAACDHTRYQSLGCTEYHDNCTDNLKMAMQVLGKTIPCVPAPFNLWMNVPVDRNGEVAFAPPVSKPGDVMTFRAELDCVVAMSACPQDVTPVNGEDKDTGPLNFEILSEA